MHDVAVHLLLGEMGDLPQGRGPFVETLVGVIQRQHTGSRIADAEPVHRDGEVVERRFGVAIASGAAVQPLQQLQWFQTT